MYPYQRGEGGFEADAFTNFGNAVGIIPIARAEFTIAPLLKGVGFLLACLPAKLPSKGLLLPCERDARAPSTRDAGNAGVPPAMPTAREKTYPFKPAPSPARRERGNARLPSPTQWERGRG